jgi:hypothetical protein
MIKLRVVLHPGILVLLTTFISFAVWLIPVGGRRGFERPEAMTTEGIVFLLAWYLGIAVSASIGFTIAKESTKPIASLNAIDSKSMYRVLSVLASAGVAFTYSAASGNQLSVILDAFRDQSVNELKATVYESYSLGIFTLRYVSAITGGIALGHIILRRKATALDLWNLVVLLAAAAVSARLLLILAVVLAVGMLLSAKPDTRISIRWAIAGVIAAFIVLTPLNYSRNANFYRTYYNETNAFEMNAHEIAAYLGAPFQVSLGVANHDIEGRIDPGDLQAFLIPSYLPSLPIELGNDPTYRGVVDVEDDLTTNSALAQLYPSMGLLAFPFTMAMSFLAGCFIGHFVRYDNYLHVAGWALLYAFAELWRIYLFNQGIIHAVALSPLAVAVFLLLLPRRQGSKPQGTFFSDLKTPADARQKHPGLTS